MSKYFIDIEFIEGKQKERFPISLFRKETPNTIDLISIGIVEENRDAFSKRIGESDRTYKGREYYAISKDFNLKEAWNRYDIKTDDYGIEEKIYWIRKNVLKPIAKELAEKEDIFAHGEESYFTYKKVKSLIDKHGKTNKQIAEEIKKFAFSNNRNSAQRRGNNIKHEFYGYYADYDWVVFCWLFGKMIDLPNGFPMYCYDLKQLLDDVCSILSTRESKNVNVKMDEIKHHPNYPKQTNEHNALSDARWDRDLYEFINRL